MTNNHLVQLTTGVFVAVWLTATLPFASVLIEYHAIPFCHTNLGWFLARLYGSFFIYPVFFGSLALVALFAPATTALVYLASNRRFGLVLLGFVVVATAAISMIEFFGSPPAAFELKPSILTSPEGTRYLDGRAAAFCSEDPAAVEPSAAVAQTIREESIGMASAGRSITGYLYYPGFAAGVLMHLLIFSTLIVFVRIGRRQVSSMAFLVKDANLILLGTAFFLSALWCLFRLTFRAEEPAIYGVASGLVGDYAAIILYLIFFAIYLASFWVDINNLSEKFSLVIQIASWIGGIFVLDLAIDPKRIFGSQSTIFNLFIVIIMLGFISFFWLAVAGRRTGRPNGH